MGCETRIWFTVIILFKLPKRSIDAGSETADRRFDAEGRMGLEGSGETRPALFEGSVLLIFAREPLFAQKQGGGL